MMLLLLEKMTVPYGSPFLTEIHFWMENIVTSHTFLRMGPYDQGIESPQRILNIWVRLPPNEVEFTTYFIRRRAPKRARGLPFGRLTSTEDASWCTLINAFLWANTKV